MKNKPPCQSSLPGYHGNGPSPDTPDRAVTPGGQVRGDTGVSLISSCGIYRYGWVRG